MFSYFVTKRINRLYKLEIDCTETITGASSLFTEKKKTFLSEKLTLRIKGKKLFCRLTDLFVDQ